jgi:hypothetical protein
MGFLFAQSGPVCTVHACMVAVLDLEDEAGFAVSAGMQNMTWDAGMTWGHTR